MAQHGEPMDVDVDSEFDNKENTYHHTNVLPCTEKGYEELDVSELNMKLRYSITPAASPMSKSYTAYVDNRNLDDDSLNCTNEIDNLTRSLNSTMTKNDSVIKSLKALPLQTISKEQIVDIRGPVLRQLDSTITGDNNVTITISEMNDMNENLSLPSSSSSAIHTPEATTPTNITKNEEGSPIIRGLKSVFNMFRSSQSPTLTSESDNYGKEEGRPLDETYCEDLKPTLASTPISAHRSRESSSKRGSPLKESISFNDDLETELQWKDETVLFSEEKIPIYKLFLQNKPAVAKENKQDVNLDTTVEYMDISQNITIMENTLTETNLESDGEFVDCETTFSKNESQIANKEEAKDPLLETTKVLDVTKIVENIEKTETEKELNEIKDPLIEITKAFDATKTEENIEKIEIEKELNNTAQTLDKTRDIALEKRSTVDDTIENQNLTLNDSVIIDVRDLIENVEAGNEILTTNNAILEDVLGATNIRLENISINKQLNIENVEKPLATQTFDVTMEIQDKITPATESIPLKSDAIPVVDAVVVADNSPIEVSIEIPLNQNMDDAQIPAMHNEEKKENPTESASVLNKTNQADTTISVDRNQIEQERKNITQLIENEQTSITQLIEHEQTVCRAIEETQNKCLPEIEVPETLKDIDSSLNDVDEKNIEKQNEVVEEKVEQLVIEQNVVPCLPDQKASNAIINSDPEKSNVIHEQTETSNDFPALSKETPVDVLDAPGHLLAEEPTNIPLPDNDDFDIDLGPNKVETIQAVTPNVLYTVKSESKLEDTVVHKFLDDTNTDENTIGEQNKLPTSELQNVLNETRDIVNSLTEIIGESQNNTIVQTEDILNESQNYVMEGIECADETHVLPDLVNQTLQNMSVDREIAPGALIPTHSELNTETIPEPNLDVTAENNAISATPNTKFEITTEQSNDTINVNKEHTNTIVASEDIEVAPKTNLIDSTKIEDDSESEKKVLDVIPNADANDVHNFVEELVVSENNSPYVSVIAEPEPKTADESFEEINIPLNTSNDAPSSPPIRSRGYNFNFDEMDDPFATKTKIRLSPPSTPSKQIEPDSEDKMKIVTSNKAPPNRRRSQPPERKRRALNNKKFNTTFDTASVTNSQKNISVGQTSERDAINVSDDGKNDAVVDHDFDKEVATILDSTQELDTMVEENNDVTEKVRPNVELEEIVAPTTDITIEISAENKSSVESMSTTISEVKTSSSEQSTYYSAAASSSDSSNLRNVFNLPEIDDKNFNPFATKSKMRQSPSLDVSIENPFATTSKIRSSPDTSMVVTQKTDNTQLFTQNVKKDTEDKTETELMEKDSSYNVSNTTSSSKGSDDKNITTREVNTEDEDTEEGPFLEAEDAIDKLLDIENEDMMQFNEIPAQAADENADGGELFIDAEAFEFLLNQNKSNVVADSGKESLFLKFDPLFAKRISSDGVLAALNKVQKRQSTPMKPIRPSLRNEASPIAGPSPLNTTYEDDTNATQDSIDDLNITVAKPMMVVTPAVNPAVTPRNKTTTPPRSNRRSITFTSPAMAVIDRLLSLSGNHSLLGHDTTVTQANREHIEADLALTQLRELLAEKEISVYQLRSESKELKDRLSTMENQVKILEADGKERLDKINELNARLAEKTKVNKSMAAVVEEYERTIASLIAETEQDKKRHAEERIRLINERDEQTAHLASMEVSFSDLHSKYEKSKQVILSCKANEEACKKSIKEFEENLTKMQTNYEMLKQHATSKLNQANQELQKINKAHESEVLKLNAMIKRKEMHITSLEETLTQKTKANEELTAICDELINKVG